MKTQTPTGLWPNLKSEIKIRVQLLFALGQLAYYTLTWLILTWVTKPSVEDLQAITCLATGIVDQFEAVFLGCPLPSTIPGSDPELAWQALTVSTLVPYLPGHSQPHLKSNWPAHLPADSVQPGLSQSS